MTPVETYKTLRASGLSIHAAATQTRRDHSLTTKQAADITWHVEAGKPAPQWLHDDGAQTQASRDWYAAAERAQYGDE